MSPNPNPNPDPIPNPDPNPTLTLTLTLTLILTRTLTLTRHAAQHERYHNNICQPKLGLGFRSPGSPPSPPHSAPPSYGGTPARLDYREYRQQRSPPTPREQVRRVFTPAGVFEPFERRGEPVPSALLRDAPEGSTQLLVGIASGFVPGAMALVQDNLVPISSASLCREGLVLHLQARIGSNSRLLTCACTHALTYSNCSYTGATRGGLRRRHPRATAAPPLRHHALLESARDARRRHLARRHPQLQWCALDAAGGAPRDGRRAAGRRVTPRHARQPAAPCPVVATQGAGHLRGEPGQRARRLR